MEYLIGFIIAVFIALTGVGAGTITTPLLILVLGVPAGIAVSVGLMFAAAVKLVLVPTQILRKQVSWRTLGYMLLGGVPGVLAGSLLLHRFLNAGANRLVNGTLGVVLVFTALWQIFFSFRQTPQRTEPRNRAHLLPWLMLPVGAEVGFSSAGAGALGSAALLSLTPLAPAQVVGTDIAFGFLTSSIGSGVHWFSGPIDVALLAHLVAGGVAGAMVGTLMAGSIPKRPLRFALWLWLLVIGGIFLYHSGVATVGAVTR
ncbi:MAG TPA: sulfite exporter TauE/SafE family protein [Acidobacteriaceae bacterium]|nr:sulfite exporter TauE/SafE family protein [Acidobacteriaceae bacterium]